VFQDGQASAAKAMRRKESVGPATKRICMSCDCGHDNMLDIGAHHAYTMRDHHDHQAQLSLVTGPEASKLSSQLGSNLGAHFASHFAYENGLVVLNLYKSYAWDLQHVEFEGLLKEHAYLMLHHLINSTGHRLSVDILNVCLSEYKVPCEHKRPHEYEPLVCFSLALDLRHDAVLCFQLGEIA
jgi:hypothetical protein